MKAAASKRYKLNIAPTGIVISHIYKNFEVSTEKYFLFECVLLILDFPCIFLFRLFSQLQTGRCPSCQHPTPVPPLSQTKARETQTDDEDDRHDAGEAGGKMEIYYTP